MAANAPRLTTKQRVFINAYLTNGFNGAQAAMTAGYSIPWARMMAYENLNKPYIKAEIRRIFDEYGMPAEEVIARLSAIARGDIGDIWDETTHTINWSKARAAGLTALIKSLYRKVTRITRSNGTVIEKIEERIELHNSQIALCLLIKHYNLKPPCKQTTPMQERPIETPMQRE
jgi:phage terminase small subunit